MAYSEKFNLSWNNFQECTSATFKDLMTEQEFTDVTLIPENGKQVRAHKVVLSACSPLFKKILLNNPHQNPLIYLTGVSVGDIEAILNFMYLGQTEVAQQDLEEFMKVASKFEIKGLSEYDDFPSKEMERPINSNKTKYKNMANVEVSRPNVKSEDNIEYLSTEDRSDLVTEPVNTCYEQSDLSTSTDLVTYDDKIYQNLGGNKTYDDEMTISEVEGLYTYHCEYCEYKSNQKHNVVAHIKAKHEGQKFYCDLCDFQASFKTNVMRHKRKAHAFKFGN